MIVVFLSAACGWLFLYYLVPYLRLRLMDQPNLRSSHSQPTPRGGGISFVVIASIVSIIALSLPDNSPDSVIPLLALPLALVGLVDDRHNLPASLRFGVQLLTAFLLLVFSSLVQQFAFALSYGGWPLFPVVVLLVIVVTAVINFTNFMDGLDGLVAGCMIVVIAFVTTALSSSWTLWSLVGSLIGFLFWNWSPAKVFMGDVGSTFLGAVFAGLVLQASSWIEAFGYLLVATPLLADACLCVLRRLVAGQRVFQAHRLHLFQRLHQAGWPHARVALTYIAATVVLAVAMLAGGWPWVFGLAVVELLIGVWLDQRVAVPFAVASRS